MSGSTRLGVDLGTTWTAAAVRRGGRLDVVTLGSDGPAMPSVVALEDGKIVAGERAARQVLVDPASGLRESKRRLGDTAPMIMGGQPYGAEDLMAHLLRHVCAAAGEADGVDEVVLTHPATWGDFKLDLVREIGRKAGVGDVTLLPEPVAAAQHYVALGRLAAGDVVAVYDFGGGTFDAAVVQCSDRGAEILGKPEGLERLGGIDLDQIVIQHVDEALDGRLREIDGADPEGRRALVQLRAECTLAKEALSNDTEATIPVAVPGLNTQVRITRDEFEATARTRVADTLGALDRAIAAAGVESAFLAGVLLVGGSSRIPLVAEEVARHVGRPTLLDADPKLVVALGAAGGGTVMTTSEKPSQADDVAGGAPVPPSSPRPSPAPGPGPSAAAQANAKAAALRAAAGQKPADKKGPSGGAVAAGVVGAAAAAAGAGYLAMEMLGDDDDKPEDEAPEEAPVDPEALADDGSLDAFDDVSGGGGGRGGGGGGGGRARFDDGPNFVSGGGGGGGAGPAGRPAPAPAPTPATDPELADISDARTELIDRFAAWKPPAGADAAEVAEFRAEVESLLNGYQPRAGQSPNDALEELRRQFDDQIEDFIQDQKLDAIIKDRDNPDLPGGPGSPGGPDLPDRPPIPIIADPPAPTATQPGFVWVKPSIRDGQRIDGHWERARARVEPEPDDGTNASRWVEPYTNQYGQQVRGHWERVRSEGPPGEPIWVAPRTDEYGNVHRGHYEHPSVPGIPVDVPSRGLEYIESRYENGRWTEPRYELVNDPGKPVDPIPTQHPPLDTPVHAATDPIWVRGHYDEHGNYIEGHYEHEWNPGVPLETDVPPPPGSDPHDDVRWVDGRYDEHGKYVKGHFEDPDHPGVPVDPPPPPDPRVTTPLPPPMPETPYPAPPTPPPPPQDVPTPTPQGPIVRDHRDGQDGGGVTVRPSPRDRDGANVRDHRGRDVEGSSPLDALDDLMGGRVNRPAPQPRWRAAEDPAPVRAGEDPPYAARMATPVDTPVGTSVNNPAGSPVGSPVGTSVNNPGDNPADAPVDVPVDGPVATAVDAAAAPAEAAPVEPEPPAEAPPPDPVADPLGTGAFANASEAAPRLNLTQEIAAPPAPPAPEPAPVPVAAVPEAPAVPEPAMAIVEPVAAVAVEVPDLNPADTDDLPTRPEDDETPSDLDTNPHTPL